MMRKLATTGLGGLSLLLAACGGASTQQAEYTQGSAVPWISQTGTSMSAADGEFAPPCNLDDLSTPAKLQKWGGAWHGQTTGLFNLQNDGSAACEVAPPAAARAITDGGEEDLPISEDIASQPVLLVPGDSVEVGIGLGVRCGKPEELSETLVFEFPDTGKITISPPALHVECGGSLITFEDSGRATAPESGLASLDAKIVTPKVEVDAAANTEYQVSLTNTSDEDISMSNCPSYQEGVKGQPGSYQLFELNCDGAGGVIKAHAVVTFGIELPPFKETRSGTSFLTWQLLLPDGATPPALLASVPVQLS